MWGNKKAAINIYLFFLNDWNFQCLKLWRIENYLCGNKTNCNIGLLTALRDKMFIRISPDIWLHGAINQHFTSSLPFLCKATASPWKKINSFSIRWKEWKFGSNSNTVVNSCLYWLKNYHFLAQGYNLKPLIFVDC